MMHIVRNLSGTYSPPLSSEIFRLPDAILLILLLSMNGVRMLNSIHPSYSRLGAFPWRGYTKIESRCKVDHTKERFQGLSTLWITV